MYKQHMRDFRKVPNAGISRKQFTKDKDLSQIWVKQRNTEGTEKENVAGAGSLHQHTSGGHDRRVGSQTRGLCSAISLASVSPLLLNSIHTKRSNLGAYASVKSSCHIYPFSMMLPRHFICLLHLSSVLTQTFTSFFFRRIICSLQLGEVHIF